MQKLRRCDNDDCDDDGCGGGDLYQICSTYGEICWRCFEFVKVDSSVYGFQNWASEEVYRTNPLSIDYVFDLKEVKK